MDPGGFDELGLAPLERRGVGVPGRHEHPHRRHRELARVERLAGLGHLLEGPGDAHVLPGGSPCHLERGGEPRRRRQVAVALEQPPPVGHDVCRVHVVPSGHPVEAEVTVAEQQGQFARKQLFYIRLNNGTRAIEDDRQRERYMAQRWGRGDGV